MGQRTYFVVELSARSIHFPLLHDVRHLCCPLPRIAKSGRGPQVAYNVVTSIYFHAKFIHARRFLGDPPQNVLKRLSREKSQASFSLQG